MCRYYIVTTRVPRLKRLHGEKSIIYVAGDVVRGSSGSTVFEDQFARHEWVLSLNQKHLQAFQFVVFSYVHCTGTVCTREKWERAHPHTTLPEENSWFERRIWLWLMSYPTGYVGIVLLYLCLPP